ncbi:MAG: hypothetical protein JO071_02090 [Deltaproteobacteria bacterium]|nr:hypothetical protein [Deltaproteobacteria bacterium]
MSKANPWTPAACAPNCGLNPGACGAKISVTEALQEYIQRRRQMRVIGLFGKIDFDPSYDYKKHRIMRGRSR